MAYPLKIYYGKSINCVPQVAMMQALDPVLVDHTMQIPYMDGPSNLLVVILQACGNIN